MIEEKEELFAVFLDTVGIQSYIFSSNKLKENVGASYLVEEIFISYLKIVLIEIGIRLTDDDLNFSNNPDTFKLLKIKKEGLDFEIGYIGGGNALLLFKKETIAKLFIQNWSRILLLYTPGLKTSVSLLETTIQELENEYQKFYKKLYELLDENKQSHSPLVTLPQHGIMAPCKLTDFSSEIHEEKDNKKKYDYISSIAYAKLNEKNLANQNKQNAEQAKKETDNKLNSNSNNKNDTKNKVVANKWLNNQTNQSTKVEYLSKEELNEFRFFKAQNASTEDNYYKTISNKKKMEIIHKYFVVSVKNLFYSLERVTAKNMFTMNYYDKFVKYDKINNKYTMEVSVDFFPFRMERKTFVSSNTSQSFSQKVIEYRDKIKNSYQTKDMNLNTYQNWIKLINDFNIFEDARFTLPEIFICSDFYDKVHHGKVFIERRQKERMVSWKEKVEIEKLQQVEDGEIVVSKMA